MLFEFTERSVEDEIKEGIYWLGLYTDAQSEAYGAAEITYGFAKSHLKQVSEKITKGRIEALLCGNAEFSKLYNKLSKERQKDLSQAVVGRDDMLANEPKEEVSVVVTSTKDNVGVGTATTPTRPLEARTHKKLNQKDSEIEWVRSNVGGNWAESLRRLKRTYNKEPNYQNGERLAVLYHNIACRCDEMDMKDGAKAFFYKAYSLGLLESGLAYSNSFPYNTEERAQSNANDVLQDVWKRALTHIQPLKQEDHKFVQELCGEYGSAIKCGELEEKKFDSGKKVSDAAWRMFYNLGFSLSNAMHQLGVANQQLAVANQQFGFVDQEQRCVDQAVDYYHQAHKMGLLESGLAYSKCFSESHPLRPYADQVLQTVWYKALENITKLKPQDYPFVAELSAEYALAIKMGRIHESYAMPTQLPFEAYYGKDGERSLYQELIGTPYQKPVAEKAMEMVLKIGERTGNEIGGWSQLNTTFCQAIQRSQNISEQLDLHQVYGKIASLPTQSSQVRHSCASQYGAVNNQVDRATQRNTGYHGY